ncbi:MAG: HlyD family type I secretion periplasmic adaptor subunit [Rhodospirillales bacterium]
MARRESKHLSKSILLEETGNPAIVRMIILFSVMVVVALIAWSMYAPLDEVAHAPGEVVTIGTDREVKHRGQVQQVQHLEGGIVADIRVQDGQTVAEGDVVLVLDAAEYLSDLEKKKKHLAVLEADKDRFRTFANLLVQRVEPACDGDEPVAQATDNSVTVKSSAEGGDNTQLALFHQMIDAMNARSCVLVSQMKQRQAELAKLGVKEQSLNEKIAIVRELVGKRETLQKKGFVSDVQLLENQIQLIEATGERKEIREDRPKITNEIEEIRGKIAEIVAEERKNAFSRLKETEDDIAQTEEDIKRLQEKILLTEIKAPVSGVVDALSVTTLGGIVEPGRTIMEILPREADMIAEVRISQRDIGHVSVGDPALIRFDTYDFGRYGGIEGALATISPTTFFDEAGNPYYRGDVTLSQRFVGKDPKLNPVLPGMTIQVDIRTGKKTVMEYLLKPIYASARQALRER